MSRALATLGLGVLALAGCSKKSQDGLPPATEWQAQPGAASSPGAADGELPPPAPPPGMKGAAGGNPHAGAAMGGDPADPHAGLDMSGNPHEGGGTDVTKLGLAAPDPNRKIDPSHRVTGVISVDAKAKDKVKPGTAVFLIVKRAGADGAPSGPPLAVDKLTWAADGAPFELTDAQAMVAGTELTGDVVVMARYDQDSDALSKQPGDVTGQIRVTIPADHVKLVLDTVLP
jgi:hypothetical protein